MLSRRLLRIKAIKALYAHFKSESESMIVSEKNLLMSIDKTYQLYHQMLFLVVEVMRYADTRIEQAKNKHLTTPEDLNPNTKFIDNELIKRIELSDDLCTYMQRFSLGWSQYPELIKALHSSMVESDYYKAYMANPVRGFKDDVKFVEDFYTHTVNDNELTEDVLEEQSIMWSDDMDFALIMVLRTLGNCRQTQTQVPLLPKFKNDEDREFVCELFRKTLVNYVDYLGYVEKFTQNWDVERIAFMDNLIMTTAMAELLAFNSIPVKVTLDEYIEIAKYYSTPGSSLFINGVLDKIVEALKKENRLEKIGRGLM